MPLSHPLTRKGTKLTPLWNSWMISDRHRVVSEQMAQSPWSVVYIYIYIFMDPHIYIYIKDMLGCIRTSETTVIKMIQTALGAQTPQVVNPQATKRTRCLTTAGSLV